MVASFEKITNTPLWMNSFENDKTTLTEENVRLKTKFRTELSDMREKIAEITSQIPADVPGLTIHDLAHLDALWDMASLIVGNNTPLNPAEAFVFGAAVLVHDAGLTLAAYPNRLDDIKKLDEWQDSATLAYRNKGVMSPTTEQIENPEDEIRTGVIWSVLRKLHGQKAEELPLQEWRWEINGTVKNTHLINDPEIRDQFGYLIGQIAASHHWSMDTVKAKFTEPQGAFSGGPNDWTIDSFRLACLLRCADAIHVDSRRATHFRMILERPTGVSKDHWAFQSKLTQPQTRENKLVFSNSSPFENAWADSWWICYDWLCMADQELQDVDDALSKTQKNFEIRGIEGIASPLTFSKYVQTSGWRPIDSTVRVSDVPSLVERLGGAALYGDKPELAIRELVQNAADAIRAKRTLIGDSYEGEIVLTIDKREDGIWLSVTDDGIGMSEKTMTGALLDFGKSFWSGEEALDEYPGLISGGFEAGGKFGIGFYSTFMLGDEVSVTSRRYDQSFQETRRLEFRNGIKLRPILLTNSGKNLPTGGTKVTIKISHQISHQFAKREKVIDLVNYYFPALEVSLSIKHGDHPQERVINGADWQNLEPKKFMYRCMAPFFYGYFVADESFGNPSLTLINPIGRAGVATRPAISFPTGVLVDHQGIRISDTRSFCGIFKGTPTNAARTTGILNVPQSALAQWGTEQAKSLSCLSMNPSKKIYAAAQVLMAGGELGDLPFLSDKKGGLLTVDSFSSLLQNEKRFYLYFFNNFDENEKELLRECPEWGEWCDAKIIFRAADIFHADLFLATEVLNSRKNISISEKVISTLIIGIVEEVWGKYTQDIEFVENGPLSFSERQSNTHLIDPPVGEDIKVFRFDKSDKRSS